MKSDSSCPVCKVPCRRREVRPAPHMDNLVSIYKNMEVTSGVNFFVTQNPPLDKPSDEKQVENNVGGSYPKKTDNKGKKSGRKGPRAKSVSENCEPIPSKSSFPTNKRVLAENTEDEPKRNSGVLREKGEPELAPFFWLREEDIEKSTQNSEKSPQNSSQLMFITPPDVPCFSDIKDSDDERSPAAEVHGNSNFVDQFDSEMFEWTQRPCSPELLPSPVKMQVVNTNGIGEAYQTSIDANIKEPGTNTGFETNDLEDIAPQMPSSRNKARKSNAKNSKSKKVGGSAKAKTTWGKTAKGNTGEVPSIHIDSKNESESLLQQPQIGKRGNSLSVEKTRNKNNQQIEPTADNICASSICKGKENMVTAGIGKALGEVSDQNSKKVRSSGSRSKKQKLDHSGTHVLKEVSEDHNQENEVITLETAALPVPFAENTDALDSSGRSIKRMKQVRFSLCSRDEEVKSCKKVGSMIDSKSLLANDHHKLCSNIPEGKSTEKLQSSSNNRGLDSPSAGKKLYTANGVALQKCQTNSQKTKCAFCQSSEESEASGEMVHYFNGRPVSQDYKDGSKIIHSHKNCTEWAPNVYFENDTAINLEAELTRGRRIKCSICKLNGAALGCYEQSCRKSYHVPCAKSKSECRWDADNFVMLCPLHASSKLPNQVSVSREKKRKRTSKEETPDKCNQVATTNCSGLSQKRNACKSPYKLVLCCSALTVEEREIVSEFEKSAGVTVLKKWDSSVTHVIASTDNNGACKRTLKVLMGILEGKWILNVEWIKACLQSTGPVDEEKYEISVDIHGIRDGPRLGRLRVQNKQPKLFDGYKFYLMGDFVSSYKGYLQDLVITAGGTILHRKPISGDQRVSASRSSSVPSSYIVYSLELLDNYDPSKKDTILNQRQADADALATSTGSKAVSNTWVLNSIAACKLQKFC